MIGTWPRGTPLHKRYGYVPPPEGGDFAHIGLESGMVYKGTTVVYQRVRRFNSKEIRKKV